ncbi:MAG TPA: hemolysin family protein, partial [Flavobacteriaceae bacterium]|nr:hemolysin family protein [Flavobacteriaceae bacterium]
AEFLPKVIFRSYANQMLYFFAPLAYLFWIIFNFFTQLITKISNFLLKIFFNTNNNVEQSEFSKEELENYIAEQLDNASNVEEVDTEIQIFQNALEFNNVKSREIMIPRTEIEAVDIASTVPHLIQLFVKTGYSKIIVYQNDLDNILGYAHAFEVFKKPKNIRSILLPVEFIPESMTINEVLNVLIKKKKSLAVVLDEFGGTSGIITVEDIVEEIFGEIIDEHDTVKLLEEKISDNEYNFSARIEIDYLNETYNLNLEENEAYETLGGYIVYHNEDIPSEKEELEINNIQFKMLKVDTSKIKEVNVKITNNN